MKGVRAGGGYCLTSWSQGGGSLCMQGPARRSAQLAFHPRPRCWLKMREHMVYTAPAGNRVRVATWTPRISTSTSKTSTRTTFLWFIKASKSGVGEEERGAVQD